MIDSLESVATTLRPISLHSEVLSSGLANASALYCYCVVVLD
jgi:hypothetical protein